MIRGMAPLHIHWKEMGSYVCVSHVILSVNVVTWWSLPYEVTFWYSLHGPSFEVYFVWYECCYPWFFFLSVFSKTCFQPFTFSLYRSFVLRWVSCRQHMCGSCFLIHSAILCLLIGAFNPFKFQVIINIYLSIAIFFIPVFLSLSLFSFLSLKQSL